MVEQPYVPQPYQAPPRRKYTGIIIAGVVVVLIIVAAIIAAGLLGVFSLFGGELSTPKAMPARVELFATARVNIEGLAGFKHLSNVYSGIPEFEEQWDEMLEDLEYETGISFEKDIQPWLAGEVAIGIVDVEASSPEVFIVIASRNNRAADAFLVKLRDHLEGDEDYEVYEEKYGGATYYAPQPRDRWDEPPIFGRANNYVLVTMNEDTMEEAIDAVQGKGETLAQSEAFKRVMQALPKNAVAYAVYPGMGDTIREAFESLEDSYTTLPDEATDQLEALQGMGVAVSLDNEGVQVDMVVTFDPQQLSEEARALMQARRGDERVLERIPANALGFYSAYDMGALWSSALATLEQDRDFARQIRDIGGDLGLTIDGDMLKWMSGGFAIAVIEADFMGQIPVSGYAVVGVSDQKTAERSLSNIVDAIADMGGLEFEKEKINGVDMQVTRDSYSDEVLFGYGFQDKFLLLALGEEAMQVATKPGNTMAKDKTFQRVRAHLPQGHGYLYFNAEAVVDFALGQMDRGEREYFEEDVLPFLEPIKAVGLAGQTDVSKGVMQTTIFIYIP